MDLRLRCLATAPLCSAPALCALLWYVPCCSPTANARCSRGGCPPSCGAIPLSVGDEGTATLTFF